MTHFLDGPAKGVSLSLHRAPLLLRVVQGGRGAWDALNHTEDTPSDDERIHVYKRIGKPVLVHVNRSGQRGGWYQSASYRLHPAQPAEFQSRDNAEWQKWCLEQLGVVSAPADLFSTK